MRKILVGMAALAAMSWAASAHAEGAEIHGFGDISVKNDYVTPRGLVVTSEGETIQVLNGLVLTTPMGISFNAGTWADINPNYGDGNSRSFNEVDFFVGASGNITPKLSLGATYVQFHSPQDAFKDERNIEVSLSYKDGGPDSKLTLNPYVKFFWAISGDSTVVLGKKGETYDVEIGAAPTFKLGGGASVSVPTWVTVGPEDYWGVTKPDGNVGVFSTGLKLNSPPLISKDGFNLSAYAQVQYYNLINDNLVAAKTLLNGESDSDHFVFAMGLNYGF